MKGPQVIPFEPVHLADIQPPVLLSRQMRDFAIAYRAAGPAFTMIEERRALGCAGLMLDGEQAHAWAFLSDRLRARRYLLHRTVCRALPALIRHYDLATVTAQAHTDFASARLWLERLGFRAEGSQPNFAGTSETYVRYRL